MKLKSASCQIAYWKGGKLQIANYLTRRTFSTHPATLNVIRFFLTPRTIQDALLEFHAYDRGSVAKSILQLIDAQLLLEHGSAELQRDEQVASSWRTWLPEGGFHFMTKDTPYVPFDWPIEKNCHEKGFGPPWGTENRPQADTERESGVGEAAEAKSGRNH